MRPIGLCDTCNTISCFAPLIAYVFIEHTSIKWRSVYWFCFAIEVYAFIMVFLFYKPPNYSTKHGHEGKSKLKLLSELDFVGFFLFATGMALFLTGINWVRIISATLRGTAHMCLSSLIPCHEIIN